MNVTGTIQVKLGFVEVAHTQCLMDFHEIYSELVRRSRPSLVSAPPVCHPILFNSSHLLLLTLGFTNRPKVSAPSALTNMDRNSKTTEALAPMKGRPTQKTRMKNTTSTRYLKYIFLPGHKAWDLSSNPNPSDPLQFHRCLRLRHPLPAYLSSLPFHLNQDRLD